jgi:hypothetical protein
MHGMVLALHVTVGAAALLAFWTAALARKGSAPHRLAGRLYLWAMWAILASAAPLSLGFFGRGQPLTGVFFLYLLVPVGTSVTVAPRAIRLKQDFAAFRGGLYGPLTWLQLGSGLAVVAAGAWFSQILLAIFGAVGVALSLRMLRLRRLGAPPAGWWLREHFTAMIANGVATHIAFLGIGLVRLLPHDLAMQLRDLQLAWYAPLAAAGIAGTWLNLQHRRRFARRPVVAAAIPENAT